ncbi:Heat shock protein beta-1 [Bagarius yarrelli]|uniref:Heat shock protein beta-1 n=1 Tax=Bagarius yarrelli TaxID=175774 RepID=A0A556VBP4_BAGYA|nr:Heat shock protein beta-1 [Bagarius yarrelli]
MEDTTTKSTVRNEESQMCRDSPLHPPGYGWQPSLLYNQHFGLPPFLDFRDLSWMESVFRKLQTSSWIGYTHPTGFAPKIHRELSGGVSEVSFHQSRWSVSLDVNHFAPSEIVVRTESGFLEIEGKHEERQDEHGFISRCFLRKYKLPAGIKAESIRSVLTGDGVLTVEATLPDFVPPANVEIQAAALEDQKQDGHQPGQPKSADVVVPSTAEKPEGDAVDADERIHRTDDGLAGPPEGLESEEEGILSQKEAETKEGEHVEGVDLTGAKEEVLDSKPEAPVAPETPEAPEAPEAPEEPAAPGAPEAPGTAPEKELEVQPKEEDAETQEAKAEGDLPSTETEGEPLVPARTQEEIPVKALDTKAVEQTEHIK